ncbi:hypothetical protein KY092_02520 [Natronomonas gomsonensis]|uniref:DUF7093 family protein n=1 Tax=Natronomonas gomsonensis TaxID=1046043 RepID=UPI0020CA569B|nr:hypothetical protein [Natronomonas gomsonensis]MCY4729430.1 hypothetical protein [Natronomonas gomsonensis]
MGLKCSLLGHAFEPADVEREREEQGSEVVTVVRELERCTRCGAERVVSESTEVTAVVDPEDVGLDEEVSPADVTADDVEGSEGVGTFDGVVERSGAADDEDAETASDASEGWSSAEETPDAPDEESEFEARDPEEEDAEILTDDGEPERAPGQWPDDPDDGPWDPESDSVVDADAVDPDPEEDLDPDSEEELSGITVPEGVLVCEECGFHVDAESAYRDGDPCPECGSWLQLERE